jgi:hypothetical protein
LAKILRQRKVLDDGAIEKATKFAETVNIDLHEAVIQQKLLTADVVMPLFADSIGLPFVDLADLTIDPALVPTVPAIMARQHSLTPVIMDGNNVIIASPKPLRAEIEEQLRLRYDASIRQVIVTKAAIDAAIAQHYPREAAVQQIATSAAAATRSSGGKADRDDKPRLSGAELRAKKLKIGGIAGAFSAMAIIFGGTMFTEYGAANTGTMQFYGVIAGAVAFGIGFLAVRD